MTSDTHIVRVFHKTKYRLVAGYALLLLICAFVSIHSFIGPVSSRDGSTDIIAKRMTEDQEEDLPCRLVHLASNKCAFIKENCEDEEAGLLSYLSLYYCDLPRAKPVAFTIILLWLGLLFSTIGIAASDFFCVNLSTIASILGTSESLAGVTFLALGNGSPDVFSTFAAMKTGSGSLAVGELVGAAGFITAVVAGSMALVRPFKVAKHSFIRDVGFFTVAASFSIYFLHDGELYYWECAAMVGFYVFYVIFVVVSHWWSGRKRKLREAEVIARRHFFVPGTSTEIEEYRDDEEDADRGMGSRTSTGRSMEDFALLENGQLGTETEIDEDEDTRNLWLGEINRNMRIARPVPKYRRVMNKPIRPSLVGALEFRAVLSSLQKSANIKPVPLIIRRYTDDEPSAMLTRRQSQMSGISDPMILERGAPKANPNFLSVVGEEASVIERAGGRVRAASAGDTPRTRRNSDLFVPTQDGLADDPKRSRGRSHHVKIPTSNDSQSQRHAPSSSASDSLRPSTASSSSESQSQARSPFLHSSNDNENRYAKPGRTVSCYDVASAIAIPASSASSLTATPTPRRIDSDSKPPRIVIPPPTGRSSGTTSPFPAFQSDASPSSTREPNIHHLTPHLFPEPPYLGEASVDRPGSPPPKWWPNEYLPPPAELYSSLFPTIYNWKKKTWWEKFLGLIAAPSVFLLTITLPVVESGSDDKEKDSVTVKSPDTLTGPGDARSISKGSSARSPGGHAWPPPIINVNDTEDPRQKSRDDWKLQSSGSIRSPPRTATGMHSPSPEPEDESDTKTAQPEDWRGWLVAVQIFCAPLFIAAVVSVNIGQEAASVGLMRLVLISLLASMCILGLVMATTGLSGPPRWRFVLCFVGFLVSIAWISTIANEVVGVIKTIGVVLDMSDAILGLTVFAVGNSLGDLVANITVARLGYPVMALSACFGGPMLNILLGIGLSGLYMTVTGAQHRQHKHPHRKVELRPYRIHINSTLLISGVTLLVTLVALLIAVPARKWRMDKYIGWGLVMLWVISTMINVILEIAHI